VQVVVDYPDAPRFIDEDVEESESLALVVAGLGGSCTPWVLAVLLDALARPAL
jgi:hypothetical protein